MLLLLKAVDPFFGKTMCFYHSKISTLVNQNILLEAKLESLTKDYNELQNKVKYQEAGIEE